jgi:acylphosphatase
LCCLALCLAASLAAGGEGVVVDAAAKSVRVPAAAAKQGVYEQLKGAIEYALVSKGGKAYESLFITPCSPEAIAAALAKIGLRPGEPAGDGALPKGAPVQITAEWLADAKQVRRSIDEFVIYTRTGKPLEARPWVFTGSTQAYDPAADKQVLQAALTKSIIGLHYSDRSPLVQNPRPEARQENIYKANVAALPPAGTQVHLVFGRVAAKAPAGVSRVHVFVSGRVQGVGFRAFTQREARRLKLTGWVKNLADGRVEAVIEGPKDKLDALLAKIRRGPRAARVTKLDSNDEPAQGDLGKFEIRF